MLFNSYEFIVLFLPITLLGFFLISRLKGGLFAIFWLVVASLFFYGYWNPNYLILILSSIGFNYFIGSLLGKSAERSLREKGLLIFGIALNLALIGYYKYANFFVKNFNAISGTDLQLGQIVLPLAISFFTFQQIAYLVDAYKGEMAKTNFLHYCLFVTFFPQLIAGPIVHYQEILPQFNRKEIYKLKSENFAVGITIFSIGLFKKVVLADSIALYGNPVFAAAEQGVELSLFAAWMGALAYSFQLYFDFSGYADMAIGIARMFGIQLPLNFYSPYKSVNIIDFWRRWHMTLSRFLRDYLYIPLGGSRKGTFRRYINLMITMLLGGLWHGAGWTFVIWGGLHGIYLVINHAWQNFRRAIGQDLKKSTWWGSGIAQLLTFAAVVMAWVFFRAESLDGAIGMSGAMIGLNGLDFSDNGFTFPKKFFLLLFIIVWFFPNTQELMSDYKPALETYKINSKGRFWKKLYWKPVYTWALFTAFLNLLCITRLSQVSEFLYFQF